jgi:hypothetical protein
MSGAPCTFANDRVPTSLGRPIAGTERIETIAGESEAQLIQAEEVLKRRTVKRQKRPLTLTRTRYIPR